MAWSILSPASPVLSNTAVALALVPGLLGAYGLIKPQRMYKMIWEAPTPAGADGSKLVAAFTQMWGTRDLFMTCAVLGAWYLGDRKMLGGLLVLGAGTAAADGFVQRGLTGDGARKHWPFVPVLLAVGAALLRQDDAV